MQNPSVLINNKNSTYSKILKQCCDCYIVVSGVTLTYFITMLLASELLTLETKNWRFQSQLCCWYQNHKDYFKSKVLLDLPRNVVPPLTLLPCHWSSLPPALVERKLLWLIILHSCKNVIYDHTKYELAVLSSFWMQNRPNPSSFTDK